MKYINNSESTYGSTQFYLSEGSKWKSLSFPLREMQSRYWWNKTMTETVALHFIKNEKGKLGGGRHQRGAREILWIKKNVNRWFIIPPTVHLSSSPCNQLCEAARPHPHLTLINQLRRPDMNAMMIKTQTGQWSSQRRERLHQHLLKYFKNQPAGGARGKKSKDHWRY